MKLQELSIETTSYADTRDFYARLLASQPAERDENGTRRATFQLPGGAPALVIIESSAPATGGKRSIVLGLELAAPDREATKVAAAARGLELERRTDSALQAPDPSGNTVVVR